MEQPGQSREIPTPSRIDRFSKKIARLSMQIRYAVTLCLSPRLTRVFMYLDRFENLDVNALIDANIHGLVIDIDATLVEHGGKWPSEPIKAKLRELQDRGIKLCFLSNQNMERDGFKEFNIPFVRNVPAKPNPQGFLVAVDQYLKGNTQDTAMVGDNPLADGGAFFAGLRFILVDPIPGDESMIHDVTRSFGYVIFNLHDWLRKLRKI